ncbi:MULTISPECIES: hypothetical protein [unclassified Microcoleus]|uniref:hypothetical protein n=1 Tax=unclassified Microcoleus TaxID=2642155 RepID=UPI002FD39D67
MLSLILLPGAGRSAGFAQKIRLLEAITSAATSIGGRASQFYSQVWCPTDPKNTIWMPNSKPGTPRYVCNPAA